MAARRESVRRGNAAGTRAAGGEGEGAHGSHHSGRHSYCTGCEQKLFYLVCCLAAATLLYTALRFIGEPSPASAGKQARDHGGGGREAGHVAGRYAA
jgi:hypothetical protein